MNAREVVGNIIAVLAVFSLLFELILVFPVGTDQSINGLALSVFISAAVVYLGTLMAGD